MTKPYHLFALPKLAGLILTLFVQVTFATPMLVPAPPKLNAKAYILIDANSGHVLVEKDADVVLEPASLTKVMTAYVVEHEIHNAGISLEEEVLISEKAWKTGGSRMFVEVNKRVPISELIKGIVIQSGNDASVAMAEYIAGSESAFADLMNQYALQLGMNNSHFVNSTGLSEPTHKTTARDLATLSVALINEFPEHYKIYSQKEFMFNDIKQVNRNKLLWRDDSVDGIKTGYTTEAGYCLVSSAVRNGMRLISVVLGSDSVKKRTDDTQKLLTYGFRFFETHKLYSSGDKLTDSRVWKGTQKQVALGVDSDFYVTIPRGRYKQLKAEIQVEGSITAPTAKGQNYGNVIIALHEQEIATVPLVALDDVNLGSWWRRFIDAIVQFFKNIFSFG